MQVIIFDAAGCRNARKSSVIFPRLSLPSAAGNQRGWDPQEFQPAYASRKKAQLRSDTSSADGRIGRTRYLPACSAILVATYVDIKPEILRWAVDRSGLPLDEYQPTVAAWLTGRKKPTYSQLETFARRA